MLHGKEMEGYMKLESIMQEDGDRFLNKRAKPLGLLQFGQVALLKKYMVRLLHDVAFLRLDERQ